MPHSSLTERAEHPRTLEAHHLFGAAFYFADDFERARQRLSQTGKTPHEYPWGAFPSPARAFKAARNDVGLR
ncbi:hypothetical protein [Actinomadura alba]|uniref:HEPN domain-containing protein n=1 Tax=Actinomadura alba TaxID=406431 RepID=A0ABR7LRZ9_9ACTN|nr:hypothetical protein [Actinomadura alba]MBC6467307.1 hypothetical protein [Actinomadura alba]